MSISDQELEHLEDEPYERPELTRIDLLAAAALAAARRAGERTPKSGKAKATPISWQPGQQPRLTPRELEVVSLMARGYTEAGAAEILGVSRHTVHTHIRVARARARAATVTHLVAIAVQTGIVHLY